MLNEDVAEALERPYLEAEERGRRDERATTVNWLRSLFPAQDDRGFHRLLDHLASAIEAEEHLDS